MRVKDGTRYDCGCVKGYYWCSRHDIYTRQRPDDLPPHGAGDRDGTVKARPLPEGCSCHLSAPCSWCVGSEEGEGE